MPHRKHHAKNEETAAEKEQRHGIKSIKHGGITKENRVYLHRCVHPFQEGFRKILCIVAWSSGDLYAVAGQLGVSPEDVERWCSGKDLPEDECMLRYHTQRLGLIAFKWYMSKARLLHGLSQEDIAKILELHLDTVDDMNKNNVIPSDDTRERGIKAFMDIVAEEERKNPQKIDKF